MKVAVFNLATIKKLRLLEDIQRPIAVCRLGYACSESREVVCVFIGTYYGIKEDIKNVIRWLPCHMAR